MLDGGEAEPGRAVAEREHPAHGDDPLGPAQGADVLQQIMFYVESYGYYDLRLAFGARTFIESFDFFEAKAARSKGANMFSRNSKLCRIHHLLIC